MDSINLINIDLRWDHDRGVVTGATGRFHRSPSVYRAYSIDGLSLPIGERLDWNVLKDMLFEEARRRKWQV